MIINPSEVKVPLKKVVTTIGGNFEVSLSKRSDSDSKVYQEFVAAYVAEVEGSTLEEAAAQFNTYEDIILENAEAGELTPAQKKLPLALQKMILKKMGKGNPDAETQKSKKDEKPAKANNMEFEGSKKAAKIKAQMIDEHTGEPLDDQTSECAMKDKKAKAGMAGTKKDAIPVKDESSMMGLEKGKAAGDTKLLSKDDKVPTCPACESLNVNTKVGETKKTCGSCKK